MEDKNSFRVNSPTASIEPIKGPPGFKKIGLPHEDSIVYHRTPRPLGLVGEESRQGVGLKAQLVHQHPCDVIVAQVQGQGAVGPVDGNVFIRFHHAAQQGRGDDVADPCEMWW